MATSSSIRLVGAGAIFIDDIVLPDGRTYMARLGGGTVHAMMGAALWDERPGISALIGNDLPADIPPWLAQFMDIQGLVTLDIPQARAWQIFEHDGTRRELHRVEEILPYVAGTAPRHLPDAYRSAHGYYLLQDFEGIRAWSLLPGMKFWEPNQLAMLSGDHDVLRYVLTQHQIDVVSPNLHEAQAVYGKHDPATIIRLLFEDHAKVVVLRMGREGSLVAVRETDERYYVPAYEVKHVADETGAGNSYNGAFLVGMLQGRSWKECAVMGTVAASFCVETVGVLDPSKISRAERDRRYQLFTR